MATREKIATYKVDCEKRKADRLLYLVIVLNDCQSNKIVQTNFWSIWHLKLKKVWFVCYQVIFKYPKENVRALHFFHLFSSDDPCSCGGRTEKRTWRHTWVLWQRHLLFYGHRELFVPHLWDAADSSDEATVRFLQVCSTIRAFHGTSQHFMSLLFENASLTKRLNVSVDFFGWPKISQFLLLCI